jgi:hypothetical protein
MVTVAKQSPKTKARPSANSSGKGVLDRIVAVSDIKTGIKLTIYGRSKTGKTRLACSFPKPLLIAGTEDGTKSVSTIKDVKFVRLLESGELTTLVDDIKGGAKWQTLVLDTAGGYQDLILKEVLGLEEIPAQKNWGMATKQEWGQVGVQFKQRLSELFNLADRMTVNIVVIAHERNFGEEGEASDVMLASVGPALTPTASGWLNGASDFIGQTFIRQQVVEKEVTSGKTTTKVKIKTGKKEFCLRVGPHDVFMTGFRIPPEGSLPDSIIIPSDDHTGFQQIYRLVKNVK